MPAPRARRRRGAGCALLAAGVLLTGCSVAAPAQPAANVGTLSTTPPATTAATATTATAPSPAGPPTTGRRIVVLDPGHNGGNAGHRAEVNRPVSDGRGGAKACNTTGTSSNAGYPEHAFTWDVAQRVQAQLVASGVHVVLTRPDDDGVGPCVDARGVAGQRANADAVVSIHADGAAPTGRGFHVAYSAPPLNEAQRGPAVELARALRDAMATAGLPTSTYLGTGGLAPRPDLAGLNHAERPAALVECANMRNAAEAAEISTPDGRQRYAAAISAGVLAFLARR